MSYRGVGKYLHDCGDCAPVGQVVVSVDGELVAHDVYLCSGGSVSSASLLARYGDEGGDYASWPLFVSMLPRYGTNDRLFTAAFELLSEAYAMSINFERIEAPRYPCDSCGHDTEHGGDYGPCRVTTCDGDPLRTFPCGCEVAL